MSASTIVRLKDVARASGVSVPTASLALRGMAVVAEATRARVRAEADRLGYIPDPTLASLASKRFRAPHRKAIIAYVGFRVPGAAGYATERESFGRVRPYGLSRGFGMVYLDAQDLLKERKPGERLRRMGVEGLILASYLGEMRLPELEWDRFSVVCTTLPIERHAFPLIAADAFEAVMVAWRRMRALGYRRIGLATPRHELTIRDDVQRAAAARACMEETEAESRIPVLCDAGMEDRAAFETWFTRHRPEAVLGFQDGQRWWLHDLGVRVPEDCAFACLHRESGYGASSPGAPAGMQYMHDEVVQVATETVAEMIQHRQRGHVMHPRKTLVEPVWWDGFTCPPKAPPAHPETGTPRRATKKRGAA
jgi:LacI family transcriptional regulator